MSTTAPERVHLGADAAGLVVMLDVAGRMVGGLEDRVALLEDALAAERRERARAEGLLARLRAYADTPDDRPPGTDGGDDGRHEPDPARPS